MLSDEGGSFSSAPAPGTLPYSQTRSVPDPARIALNFAFRSGKRNQGMPFSSRMVTPIGNVPGKKKFSSGWSARHPKAPATGSPDKLGQRVKIPDARARTFADPVEVLPLSSCGAFRYLLMRSCNALTRYRVPLAYHADRNWPCRGFAAD